MKSEETELKKETIFTTRPPISHRSHPLITETHLRRHAFIYCRQSTEIQVRDNQGSTEYQKNQVQSALAFGWDPDLIKLVDADLGKSGSSTESRAGFNEMCEQIAANRVGAVFVVDISRLSRQLIEFEKLRILATYHEVLFIVDGRVVDPKDPTDMFVSQLSASHAMFENFQRTQRMTKARLTRARAGEVVSLLPVGWIKKADGSLDYDPETSSTIRMIFRVFFKEKSLRKTARELNHQDIQLPRRTGDRLEWTKATIPRVGAIVNNMTYCGAYVYRKTESAPELGITRKGYAFRKRLPRDQWVIKYDHHPAYISLKQHEEIRAVLEGNAFIKRSRPGDGSALLQGLLECGRCGRRLEVKYRGEHRGHHYLCNWKSKTFGEKMCMVIEGEALDEAIVRQVLQVLEAPPKTILAQALAESREAETIRLGQIEDQKERLEHTLKKARERYVNCDSSLRKVFRQAQVDLEEAMQALEDFNQQMPSALQMQKLKVTEEDLGELCSLAASVPELWHHPLVSHRERKEIIRCMIEKITVEITSENASGTIHWVSGQQTQYSIWRRRGRANLLRELHAEGLGVNEMKERLVRGETSTGQVWNITIDMIYMALRKIGLSPHRFCSRYRTARDTARNLYGEYQDLEKTAQELNRLDSKTLFNERWTPKILRRVIKPQNQKKAHFEAIAHRKFLELHGKNHSDQELADKFNAMGIPRWNGRRWLGVSIRHLRHRLQRTEHEFFTGTSPSG